MKKFTVNIDTSLETNSIVNNITESLYPILQWYNPLNHSDLYYIKIYITKSLSLIIKWEMPFNKQDSSSYVLYSYVSSKDSGHKDMLISSSILNIKQLKIVCDGLSRCIIDIINTISNNNINKIIITTNLDSDTAREQRGFKQINVHGYSEEEKFINFIYYIGQILNKHTNYAMVRLNISIYLDEYECIEGVYEVSIHCSEVFDTKTYDILFSFPQDDKDPIFGLMFSELTEVLYNVFNMFKYVQEVACTDRDDSKITYYIIKQEVTH